ncbi:protein kinase family protein [Vibrio fluvialis]|uniref:protein kinase domain-containing protein n=1 Tax=Vibrio fluvialis TaxID=676 RepID=UPI00192BA062|nr:protein kinase family protein [Vibrio fluvialis]
MTLVSNRKFATSVLFQIAGTIKEAARHLHHQRVMHGDLYAHNILITSSGDALLSDYGAASFFDVTDPNQSAKLQRVEVRAFGCLLEELTERCDDLQEEVRVKLEALAFDCQHRDIMDRPTFDKICNILSQVQSTSRYHIQWLPCRNGTKVLECFAGLNGYPFGPLIMHEVTHLS